MLFHYVRSPFRNWNDAVWVELDVIGVTPDSIRGDVCDLWHFCRQHNIIGQFGEDRRKELDYE